MLSRKSLCPSTILRNRIYPDENKKNSPDRGNGISKDPEGIGTLNIWGILSKNC